MEVYLSHSRIESSVLLGGTAFAFFFLDARLKLWQLVASVDVSLGCTCAGQAAAGVGACRTYLPGRDKHAAGVVLVFVDAL